MAPEYSLEELYDRIDAIGAVATSALVFRHIAPHRECKSGEGARSFGGRWNPPRSFPALYTTLSEECASVELARLARRQNRSPSDFLPRLLCRLRVDLQRLIDLRPEANLEHLGLSSEIIAGDDLERCQEAGSAIHYMGFEGMLVASATGRGDNLVIFELNLLPSSRIDEVSTRLWETAADVGGS